MVGCLQHADSIVEGVAEKSCSSHGLWEADNNGKSREKEVRGQIRSPSTTFYDPTLPSMAQLLIAHSA